MSVPRLFQSIDCASLLRAFSFYFWSLLLPPLSLPSPPHQFSNEPPWNTWTWEKRSFIVSDIITCQFKKCLFYSRCRQQFGRRAICDCPPRTDSGSLNDPVCGSDGTTYPNEEYLRIYSCRERRVISALHKGACVTGIYGGLRDMKVCGVITLKPVYKNLDFPKSVWTGFM